MAIPQAEIVERKQPKQSISDHPMWRQLKGTIRRMVLCRPQRTPEFAAKHTTRRTGPGTHADITQDHLVRRRRAAALSFGGSGDAKYDDM